MRSKNFLLVFIGLILVFFSVLPKAQAATPARLLGRILLQVESNGEAWYVNPLDGRRYFLGRPADAFNVMRALGLGVANKDFAVWNGAAPRRLAGRIVLKVESAGEAYYIHPDSLRLYFLGRPTDAFNVMRNFGLGITNANLAPITAEFNLPIAAAANAKAPATGAFTWSYQNQNYGLTLPADKNLWLAYQASPKSYQYYGQLPTNWHEEYYAMFLTSKTGDSSFVSLANQLTTLAGERGLTGDQLVELTLSFVQAISYDQAKAVATDSQLNYPYETLYQRRGVCSDKVLLVVVLLRQLGYGAAILDLPDINHAAVGIQCPTVDSFKGSGYCYGETTNVFPLGFLPSVGTGQSSLGQAQGFKGQFVKIFDPTPLGKLEIYQKTQGKQYGGLAKTKERVALAKSLEAALAADQAILNSWQLSLNNKLVMVNSLKAQVESCVSNCQASVDAYNRAADDYNQLVENYRLRSQLYNDKVSQYNNLLKEFYPNK